MSRQNNEKRDQRSRGAAMLLVLIAVAMCTIMALSFLTAQEPTAVVASNIDRKTQARAIAESALKMAIDYVNEDPDWRRDKTSGVWMTDVALDGGIFTLSGVDEEDDDLKNDRSQAVLLTVVANYAGVTHRVSARVLPSLAGHGTRLVMVVGDAFSLSTADQTKQAYFETWGFDVTLLDDSAAQASYDALLEDNDVVYVSKTCNASSVGTKLRDTILGVVCEQAELHDEFGFTTASSTSMTSATAVDISAEPHVITWGFSAGSLEILDTAFNLSYATSTIASGVTSLAERSGAAEAVLMIANTEEVLHHGSAAGRRVMYGVDTGFDFDTLSTDGKTIVRRSLKWAAGGDNEIGHNPIALYKFEEQPVADPALVGHWRLDDQAQTGQVWLVNRLTLNNGSYIDAYDSSNGTYGGTNQQLDAGVTTNTTGAGHVHLTNGTIHGDIQVGSTADPASVISIGAGSITGSQTAQTVNIPIPTHDAPLDFGGHTGNERYNGGAQIWSANAYFNKLTIQNGAVVTVVGDVQVKVANEIQLDNGHIVLAPGASLTLWAGHDVVIEGGSTINYNTSRTADFSLIQYGNIRNTTLDDAIVVGAVHVANDLTLSNGSALYGNVYAEHNITIDDGAIHADLGSKPPGGGIITAFLDETANNNHGVSSGAKPADVGVVGSSFEFDGGDDYLVVPHQSAYLMDAGTVSLHFYPTGLGGHQSVFSKESSGHDTGGHLHICCEGTQLVAQIQTTSDDPYGTGATVELSSASGVISENTWHHVAVTWGDGQFRMYLDGVLVVAANHLGGLGATSGGTGNQEPIVIGASSMNSADQSAKPVDNYFTGRIDDVRIYDLPIDVGQAVNLAAGSDPGSRTEAGYVIADTSAYDTAADMLIYDTSAVSWLESGGLAVTGDTLATTLGSATKIHDAIEANQAFSIELIFSGMTPAATDQPSHLFGYTDAPGVHNLLVGQDASKYEIRVRDSVTGTTGVFSPEFVSTTDLSVSADTHLLLTYVEGEVSVYIDGELDSTQSVGGVLDNWSPDLLLALFAAYDDSRHWQGTIKRLTIYDASFNVLQVANVFDGDSPGTGEGGANGSGSVQWDELD